MDFFLCSHFVSAKTDDLINSLFLKVSAEALGVKLSHVELDKAATVVKAEIVQHKAKDASSGPKQPVEKRTKSSFCTVQ